jgi:hypothetical protein
MAAAYAPLIKPRVGVLTVANQDRHDDEHEQERRKKVLIVEGSDPRGAEEAASLRRHEWPTNVS